MTWASWTTCGVFAGRDGVRTSGTGPAMTGELDVHTTWTEADGLAHVTVQCSGAADWVELAGSPLACPSEAASRALHDEVIHFIRAGATHPLAAGRALADPATAKKPPTA
ncbi:hypothetical protein ACFWA6_18960 [Streptomyces sp. NPDC060020]|uniref:hypothetical protein n=1 Tax=Streptomyces sp. NPDC060020 TaxID=3347038 RepID=UPI0036AD5467